MDFGEKMKIVAYLRIILPKKFAYSKINLYLCLLFGVNARTESERPSFINQNI